MLLLLHQRGKHKMAERPFHDAFLAKRVPCEVCYRQKKEIKFFLHEGGADHHFRTMHKQKFGEEMQRKCEELMKRKHGEETLVYIDTLMKSKAEKVGVYGYVYCCLVIGSRN